MTITCCKHKSSSLITILSINITTVPKQLLHHFFIIINYSILKLSRHAIFTFNNRKPFHGIEL